VFALSCAAAFCWVVVCAIAALPLLVPPDRRPTWSEYGAAAALGASALGVGWVLARLVSHGPSARVVAVLPVIVAIAVVSRRRRRLLPDLTKPGRATFVSCVVLAAWLAPAVAGAWLMGRGVYPAVFFHSDTPLRLAHARVLQEPGPLPPPSLANVGRRPDYHYGGPGVAAAIAGLSGLPVHTAFFVVAIPLAVLGLFCAARLLAAALAAPGSLLHVGLSTLILTAWSRGMLQIVRAVHQAIGEADASLALDVAGRIWQGPQSFGNAFPDVTAVFGSLLLMIAARPLVSSTRRHWCAAAVAVFLLGQVRAGVGVVAVIVVTSAALLELVRGRRLLPAKMALAGGAAALFAVHAGGGDPLLPFTVTIEPLWLVRHFRSTAYNDFWAALLFVGLPGVIIGTSLWTRHIARAEVAWAAAPTAAAIAAVYIAINIVGASIDERTWEWRGPEQWIPWSAWTEPLREMPMLFALVGAIGLAKAWTHLPRRANTCAVAIIAGLTTLPLAHRATGAGHMLFDPASALEYVDNRQAAQAMAAIPLRGTVTATNDLRYPSFGIRVDSRGDLRQYQLSGLFGHQTFAAPGYERYPGWQQRVALQKSLANDRAGCEVLQPLMAAGVTHLLLHKRIAYPRTLPVRVLYDDEAFVSVELRGVPC
jgi:hypothetical protein